VLLFVIAGIGVLLSCFFIDERVLTQETVSSIKDTQAIIFSLYIW
jgi:hypothetical protein